jgi:hypothetical protein
MLLGWSADRLRRHGIGREAYYAVIALLFITAQMMLILHVPMPSFIPWGIIAAVGAATVLSFAMLPEYFPMEISGRANAALNILHLGGAFALQYLTGVIVSRWPSVSGHPPVEAYEVAFGLSVVVQLLALLWFLCSARWATIPRFSATCRPQRMGPALASLQHNRRRRYATAGLAIARHIAGARRQAAHWRLIGIGSATLCACLSTLVVLSTRSDAVVVHVVETPSFVTADDDTRAQGAKLLVASVSYRGGSGTRCRVARATTKVTVCWEPSAQSCSSQGSVEVGRTVVRDVGASAFQGAQCDAIARLVAVLMDAARVSPGRYRPAWPT